MSTTKLARIGLATATLALGVGACALSTGAASASGGGSAVERRGPCTRGSDVEAEGQA